jgi:hypothetical protein
MSTTTLIQMPGLTESARLLAAAAIGTVSSPFSAARREQPLGPSMEQTHVLLCLAGALMMLTVGDSLPRAFGIAGAAAIIRFRTPVDDARDTTVLFLVMALGMAAGLGLATVAIVGALFVCGCLLLLRERPSSTGRSMKVALVAKGQQFPTTHVLRVFGRTGFPPSCSSSARRTRPCATARSSTGTPHSTRPPDERRRSGITWVSWKPRREADDHPEVSCVVAMLFPMRCGRWTRWPRMTTSETPATSERGDVR